MYLTSDPGTALQLARLQQAEVRASFPRRPRRARRLRGERHPAPTLAPRPVAADVTSVSAGLPQEGPVIA